MIELFVYPKPQDERLINYSPFCAKTEVFLRLNNIKHTVKEFRGNPGSFPKSKLPVIKHNGKLIADSYFIQKYLEQEFNTKMDDALNEQQRADGWAYLKMVEEYLYWSMLYERWAIDSNWKHVKEIFFYSIPALIKPLMTSIIRKQALKAATGHGMGRHSETEVFELGTNCIRALADKLKKSNFLLGEQISSYDTSVFCFVGGLLYCDLNPILQAEAKQHPSIIKYWETMAQKMESQNN